LIQQLREQQSALAEHMKILQERLAKDNHNSHLPPSSDRLVRRPKSLRKKSEKQSGGQPAVWAADLKELLLDMKQATQQAREQGKLWLDPLEVVDWEARFLELLAEGDRLHPHAVALPGARGRCKQRAARNLLDRLRKHRQAVLEDLRVDFENNLAERDLRMVKVQ
jgi:hypothetical protein